MEDLAGRLFPSLEKFREFFNLFSQKQSDSQGGVYVEVSQDLPEADKYSLVFRVDAQGNYSIEIFMTGYSSLLDELADKTKWEFASLKETEESDLKKVQQGYVVVWLNGEWVHYGWWQNYIEGFFRWLIDEENLLGRMEEDLSTTKPGKIALKFDIGEYVVVTVTVDLQKRNRAFFKHRSHVPGIIRSKDRKTKTYIVEFNSHQLLSIHEDFLQSYEENE